MMRVLLCISLAAALTAAQLDRKPYVQNVSATQASILWTTVRDPGEGLVSFGSDLNGVRRTVRSRIRSIPSSESGISQGIWQHQADLTDLTPDTQYFYRVTIDGTDVLAAVGGIAEWQFRTAAHDPFTFLAFGDSGDGGAAQRELNGVMNIETASLILHVGDLAYYEGTFKQFEEFYFGVYWQLMRHVPVFPAPGNHDYEFANGRAYLGAHSVPTTNVPASGRGRYYSFDWGNVHFVSLDSNPDSNGAIAQEMVAWLQQDLTRTARWFRVVYFHHTPFPTAVYAGDAWCDEVRRTLTPIIEQQGVHLVLSGHEHVYQRSKPRANYFLDRPPGTVYVTTGGAGSNVYPPGRFDFVAAGAGSSHYLRATVSGNAMRVQAIGPNREVLDDFPISASPSVLAGASAADANIRAAARGLISIYGFDLAQLTSVAPVGTNPTELANVAVHIGGAPVPLLFVSRLQINAQLPAELAPGEHTLTVRTAAGEGSTRIRIDGFAPSVFRVGYRGTSLPAVLHTDGSLVAPEAPGVPGEWLSIFLTGMGKPSSAVQVSIQDIPAETSYAGVAPGLPGVDQINVRVPESVAAGAAVIRIISGGVVGTAPGLYIARAK